MFSFERSHQGKKVCYRLTPKAYTAIVALEAPNHSIWDKIGGWFPLAIVAANLQVPDLERVSAHVQYLELFVEASDVETEAEPTYRKITV